MANRGGGRFDNGGRGPGSREGGFNGGHGRGVGARGSWNNGRRDDGYNGASSRNFYQGSSSGTAGDGDGSGNGQNNINVFNGGVFRAGPGNHDWRLGGYNNGRERFNNPMNYNRGNGYRYNNQGIWNNNRNHQTGQGGNQRGNFVNHNRNVSSTVEELNVVQSQLLKETAAALARQLAELPNLPTGVSAEVANTSAAGVSEATVLEAQPASTVADVVQPVKNIVVRPVQQQRGLEDVMMAIAAPKPILYGMAHEELMFWEFPSSNSVRPRMDNTRLSRVTISDGSMTTDKIISHLKWMVPHDQYQWEVRHVEGNVYRVTFPSKVDLSRAQYSGTYNIPNSKTTMKFEAWKKPIQPAWKSDNIWVRIYDLPSEALDDFLGLCAVGNLFGKTMDIDMEFTRRTEVLRINIDCLDPTLISARMDIRIKDEFYKLRLEVEGIVPPSNDIRMDDAPNPDGDGSDRGQDEGHGSDNRDPKRSKNVTSEQQKDSTNGKEPMTLDGNNLKLSPLKVGSFELSPKVEKKMTWADMVDEDEELSKSAPPKLVSRVSGTELMAVAKSSTAVPDAMDVRQAVASLRQGISARTHATAYDECNDVPVFQEAMSVGRVDEDSVLRQEDGVQQKLSYVQGSMVAQGVEFN